MPTKAMEVVRSFVDMVATKDFVGAAEHLDPDVVFLGTRGGLDEARVLRGGTEWITYMREIEDPWRRWDIETERLIDLGDTVVAFVREVGEPRHADLEVHNETAVVFRVARQKIVEARGYLDRDEALRVARGTV